jgi:uncharacterized protein YxeA
MKKIFTTAVLLLIGIIAYSQTWKALDLDSATFHDVYGTEEEYRMQSGLAQSNKRDGGGGRVAIIGMKSTWLSELQIYIQQELLYTSGETKVISGKYVTYYTENVASNGKAKTLTLTVDTDDDNRTRSLVIRGSVNAMLDLFTGYWFDPGAQRPYLSDNGTITRQFLNDKVTIKKTGTGAVITVSK